jgi:hypothetical protein
MPLLTSGKDTRATRTSLDKLHHRYHHTHNQFMKCLRTRLRLREMAEGRSGRCSDEAFDFDVSHVHNDSPSYDGIDLGALLRFSPSLIELATTRWKLETFHLALQLPSLQIREHHAST